LEDYDPTMPNLQELNLSNNKISKIEDEFFDTVPNIVQLNLAFNQLTIIPERIFSLASLKHLDIVANEIETIPKKIENFNQDFSLYHEWGYYSQRDLWIESSAEYGQDRYKQIKLDLEVFKRTKVDPINFQEYYRISNKIKLSANKYQIRSIAKDALSR